MNNVDIGSYKRIVQYFWDPEPKNDDETGSPIWCLGREYASPSPPAQKDVIANAATGNGTTTTPGPRYPTESEIPAPVCKISDRAEDALTGVSSNGGRDNGWPDAFLDDMEARIWLTYRSNFPIIPKSEDPNAQSSLTLGVRLRSQLMESQGFTSDTGWGCMIRSGQSLLANALSFLRLGRDWRRGSRPQEESRLIALFADHPSAPFSIHRFVQQGASSCGKYPGEWFGPSATARCIQYGTKKTPMTPHGSSQIDCRALSRECHDAGLNVYVTSDTSDVYEDKFRTIARGDSGKITPTLILLGLRLGIDRVTPAYWEGLKAILQCPQSTDHIIPSGRPSASHYFVGVQGDYFFYLDPHHTRPALPYRGNDRVYSKEELDTYHTRRLRRLHIKDMDPSMLIGFLIKDEEDWADWTKRVSSVQGKPIVHIYDSEAESNHPYEREGALDEVETLDDEDDEETRSQDEDAIAN
ncbi:autophagy-related protein 4 [Paecilomyces variotii No. 5]|uniref:Cysteine protease n=1 Tax=Byssochlamys spectabilis (strain No. 5 / NBRC 109023) TaxID=1356009 RepID=V5GCQ6_BYSSN|nr:autophagy-related protein 4 [Paecilomyces variotii No. 5]